MVKVGLPLSLTGALVAGAMIHVTGGLSWTFDINNSCPDYLSSDVPCKLATTPAFELFNTSASALISNTTDAN